MKETAGSLRAYFLFVGVVSMLLALRDLSNIATAKQGVWGVHSSLLSMSQRVALYVPAIIRLPLGVGHVIAGLRLKTALLTGAGWIKKLLVVSGAMLFISGALVTAEFGAAGAGSIVGALLGLAITIYLHRSVTRLAAEAAARAGIAPPPPTAKVV